MNESVEQIDPTQELTTEVIKKRAIKGAAILTGRNVVLQLISFIAMALFTLFLLPAEYGTFFLVSATINFLAYFGDIGFAASLIQKKGKLESVELKTIFTAQMVLTLAVLVLAFLATPLLQNFYNLSQPAIHLYWVLLLSLFLASLKTIPTVLMERKLEFNKWVIPQIIEALAFNIVAVTLAWKGFGITSFTIAVLVRSILGLLVTYIVSPWRPAISFSLSAFKSTLKFGVPYQINTLLAMVKDDGMILFLGGILGTHGIGLLGWAQKWAYAPLRFFMDQVIKVTFPAFSRLQQDKKELSQAVTKSIFFICALVFPALIILILVTPILTAVIPKYDKWNPALFALSVLSISSALAAITTPLTNTLNAIGKISLTFKLMVMWTTLTWIFVPVLAYTWGVNGAAIGFSLVGLSSFVALFLVSSYVSVNYIQAVVKPATATAFMGMLLLFIRNITPTSFFQAIILIVIGLLFYAVILLCLEPSIMRMIKNQIKKNV